MQSILTDGITGTAISSKTDIFCGIGTLVNNDLKTLFLNVFEHCIEAAGKKQTDVLIFIDHFEPSAPFIEIEIVNRGFFVLPEEIQNAFIPFYSSKPYGTGFGLSIARLAARKNLGDIYLENMPDRGMVYLSSPPLLRLD